jgi:hypothetical protein
MTSAATYLWRPSNARYIEIDGFVPTPRGPQIPPVKPLAWPQKDPSDTLDYVFDIAPAVSANPGDGITAVDVAIAPDLAGDLSLVSSYIDGTRAVLWLAGGQPGITYTVTVSVTTAAGRSLSRSIALPVVALALVTAAPNALTTPAGNSLTGPSGSPLTTA